MSLLQNGFPAGLLLALHLAAPWYLLLVLQCCFYTVETAIPIAFQYTLNNTIPLASKVVSTFKASERSWTEITAAFLSFLLCATIVAVGVAKKMASTRAATKKKETAAAERAKRNEGLNKFQQKVEAARLWHGQGKKGMGQHAASEHQGIGQAALKGMLDRAFIKYNAEHVEEKQLKSIEAFRILPFSTFKTYLSPAEMGRGDTLSDWEFQEIQLRYEQRSRSFKDAPDSKLTNDSETDDFAAVINEVFAESRTGQHKQKRTAEVTLFVGLDFCAVSCVFIRNITPASFENGQNKWALFLQAQCLDQIRAAALLAIGAI